MLESDSHELLERLLATPSPPGSEQQIQALVRETLAGVVDEVSTDVHGNVIAVKNPGGAPKLLLDGHCDHIALMVQHVDESGFLWVQPMGGWDPLVLIGQRVTVWTADGPLPGVMGRKAKHLQESRDQKERPKIESLWIDLGTSKGSLPEGTVRAGDVVTLELGARALQGDRLSGPRLDNAAGLFVVLETMRRLAGREVAPAVYAVSAVQEEIGLRGAQTAAFGVQPQMAVGVDVTHATDTPTVDIKQHASIELGGGPVIFRGPNVNPRLHRMLLELAADGEIAVQHKGAPRGTPNDANVLQLTGAGVATAALGIPLRYMHTPVEIVDTGDLDRAATLLVGLVERLDASVDLTP